MLQTYALKIISFIDIVYANRATIKCIYFTSRPTLAWQNSSTGSFAFCRVVPPTIKFIRGFISDNIWLHRWDRNYQTTFLRKRVVDALSCYDGWMAGSSINQMQSRAPMNWHSTGHALRHRNNTVSAGFVHGTFWFDEAQSCRKVSFINLLLFDKSQQHITLHWHRPLFPRRCIYVEETSMTLNVVGQVATFFLPLLLHLAIAQTTRRTYCDVYVHTVQEVHVYTQ